MSDEKMITQGEHQKELAIMVAITRVETLQVVANKAFDSHKDEDRIHFDRIYDTLEDIAKKMGEIPATIINHGEQMQENTLAKARKEFNPITEFKIFQTKVTSIIVGVTIAGSLLGVALNWLVQTSKLIS